MTEERLGRKRKQLDEHWEASQQLAKEAFIERFLAPLALQLETEAQARLERFNRLRDKVAITCRYRTYYSGRELHMFEVLTKEQFQRCRDSNPEFHLGSIEGKHSSVTASFEQLLQSWTEDPQEIADLVDSDSAEEDLADYPLSAEGCDFETLQDFLDSDPAKNKVEAEAENGS